MDFSVALTIIKRKMRVRRRGWPNRYISMTPPDDAGETPDISMILTDPLCAQSWTPAPGDLMADDWEVC
jgi:hypothetical protein